MTAATLSALKIGDRVRDTHPDCPRKGTVIEKPDHGAVRIRWDAGTHDYAYADDYRGMDDFGESLLQSIQPDDDTPLPEPVTTMFASIPVEGPPYLRPMR